MDSSIWGCVSCWLMADMENSAGSFFTAHLIGEVQLIGKSCIIGLRQTSQQTSMFQRFWRVSLIHVKSIEIHPNPPKKNSIWKDHFGPNRNNQHFGCGVCSQRERYHHVPVNLLCIAAESPCHCQVNYTNYTPFISIHYPKFVQMLRPSCGTMLLNIWCILRPMKSLISTRAKVSGCKDKYPLINWVFLTIQHPNHQWKCDVIWCNVWFPFVEFQGP